MSLHLEWFPPQLSLGFDRLTKERFYTILISLNNNQADTLTKAGQAYDWLLNLMLCRHKILCINHQAREKYPQARELYAKLDRQMQALPNDSLPAE